MQRVARDITHIPRTEVPPRPPASIVIDFVVRTRRRRPAPLVPIHPRRRRLHLGRSRQSTGTVRSRPVMHRADRPDGTAHQQLRRRPRGRCARVLNARLSSHAGSETSGLHPPVLCNRARDRLGTVDVLVHRKPRQHQVRVPVVRRGNDQRVDVLLFTVEHLPEVLVQPGLWIELERGCRELVVQVA